MALGKPRRLGATTLAALYYKGTPAWEALPASLRRLVVEARADHERVSLAESEHRNFCGCGAFCPARQGFYQVWSVSHYRVRATEWLLGLHDESSEFFSDLGLAQPGAQS